MTAGNRGMLAGALVGILAAVSNWEGNVGQAASSIIIAAAIGFVIGRYFGNRRTH